MAQKEIMVELPAYDWEIANWHLLCCLSDMGDTTLSTTRHWGWECERDGGRNEAHGNQGFTSPYQFMTT